MQQTHVRFADGSDEFGHALQGLHGSWSWVAGKRIEIWGLEELEADLLEMGKVLEGVGHERPYLVVVESVVRKLATIRE
jgi:hypothetical protein